MTIHELNRSAVSRLTPLYGRHEAEAMVRLIFHALKGWELTDIVIHANSPVSDWLQEKFDEFIPRLLAHEPVQYVLGEASFYGMRLKVGPGVLIPRPETEELVDMIVKGSGGRADLRVLDIGTGSGAIAIALSRNLPFSKVTALDISEDALTIARRNAAELHARIDFIHADIFDWIPSAGSLDIIVSNPPYICEQEKAEMDANVLDYEPPQALFVADATPLIFYSRILEIASEALSSDGSVWFEINPHYAEPLKQLALHHHFRNVSLIKDLYGKERFLTALRPAD